MTIQWRMDPVTTSQPTGNKQNKKKDSTGIKSSKHRFSRGKTKII